METKNKPYPINEEWDEKQEKLVLKEPPAAYGLENSIRYTYADYMSWTDDKRREIIHGTAYDLFSAPMRFHAGISTVLTTFINSFILKKKGKCKIYHAPFDVRFPRNGETADDKIRTVVQPDICVVCDPSKLDDRGCIGAPDLIVEVQSPSTARRDMHYKFDLYEEFGVREYWVVFPNDKAITVFLLQENGLYDRGTTYELEGKVPVGIFEGLEIDLKELFER